MSEEWIETNGARPDLPDGTLVHTKYGGGSTSEATRPAGIRVEERRWELSNLVVAYKLATPAKAERESIPPSWKCKTCGFHWSLGYWYDCPYCKEPSAIQAPPRWVRCDDRLPGDGREYKCRHVRIHSSLYRLRVVGSSGQITSSCNPVGTGFMVMGDVDLANHEWLDEAPAQEGQINAAPLDDGSQSRAAESTLGVIPSGAAPYPAGTLTRAMRQRAAESERVAGVREFGALFGSCRGRVG